MKYSPIQWSSLPYRWSTKDARKTSLVRSVTISAETSSQPMRIVHYFRAFLNFFSFLLIVLEISERRTIDSWQTKEWNISHPKWAFGTFTITALQAFWSKRMKQSSLTLSVVACKLRLEIVMKKGICERKWLSWQDVEIEKKYGGRCGKRVNCEKRCLRSNILDV